MSKTTTTQNTNQYTSSATGAQNTLSSTYTPMVKNPYSGANYNMGLQQNTNAANSLGMNAVRNAMQNFNMSGSGNLTGGARASLLSGLSRQTSGMRQQGFFNNWNTATANQQFGANVLGQLSGQLAGTTSTQKTSGLGTWLPQLIGAGIGVAAGFATGRASMAAKGLGAAGGAAAGLSGLGGGSNPNTSPAGAGANYWNPIPQSPSIFPNNFNAGSMYGSQPGLMQVP